MAHDTISAYAKLNAKLGPLDRGERFESPLLLEFEKNTLGKVTGGGTLQNEHGEIEYCGIDIDLFDLAKGEPFVCAFLTDCGAPKGSTLQCEHNGSAKRIAFGRLEGLAIYLNGTDLPSRVYEECNINVVADTFAKLLGDRASEWSSWHGPRESALYYYGDSFEWMRGRISGFIAEYPLCQKSRVAKIA